MKKSLHTLGQKLVVALVALSMVLGAGAAQAANQTLGDAELKAAYAASNIQAMKAGFVMMPPALQIMTSKAIYAPKSTMVPANVAVTVSFGGTSAATLMNVHDTNPLNPLGSGDSSAVTDVLEAWFEVANPDEAGLALDIASPEDWTLEEYEVTRPADGQIAVHLVKRSGTMVDQNSNPIVEEVDAIFTLDAGLITSVNVTSNIPNNTDEGVTTISYDPVVIADEFAAAVSSWKQTRFDSTSLTLAMRITNAFQSSKTAALKTGVTIKSSGKSIAGLGLYNSSLKKSVAVRQDAAKPGSAVNSPASLVAFKGVEETFGDVWSYLLGFDQFEKGSIKYSSKTSTYTLRGSDGRDSTIKLNLQGRVASVSTTGFIATTYTFTYSTDKALWSKWGNFGPKTQALMTWIVGAKNVVWGSKLVFTRTKTGVKATGARGYSAQFNTSGISASTVAVVFKQLGFVLK
jgi:hypothetical protein